MIIANVGDKIRITATFIDINGLATDPTIVRFKILSPNEVETLWQYPSNIQKESTGIYYAEIPIIISGKYLVKFEGLGAVMAATEDILILANSKFIY